MHLMQVLYQLSYLQVLQWLQLFTSPQEAYEGLPPSPPTSSRALPPFPHHSLSDQGRWSPSMEKICLSLMTKNVDHFFVHFFLQFGFLWWNVYPVLLSVYWLEDLLCQCLMVWFFIYPTRRQVYSWSISFSILYAVSSVSCFLCLTEVP